MKKYPNNIYFGDLNNNKYTIVKKQNNILAFFSPFNYDVYKSLISNKKFKYRNFIELDSLNNLLLNNHMTSEEIDKLVIGYLDYQTHNREKKDKVLRKLGIKYDRY